MRCPVVKNLCSILAVAGAVWMVGAADATADFAYQYEMNVDPTGQDWDNNTHGDWAVDSGAGTMGLDGSGHYEITKNAFGSWAGLRANNTTGLWGSGAITAAAGFTVEAKLKVVSQYQGTDSGAISLFLGTPTSSDPQGYLQIGSNSLQWGATAGTWMNDVFQGPGTTTTMGTADNTDAYHTFRVARSAGADSWSIWRDGDLMGSGLAAPFQGGIADPSLYVGCYGDGTGGSTLIDYIHVGVGVVPVPEPGSVACLVSALVGMLAYAWRKRKE